MTQHLFLFQIGPVQTFIAASRRTQDLYVGSRLLSDIARAGVQAAEAAGGSLVFPVKHNGVYPQSISHIFACMVTTDRPEAFGQGVEEALRQRWAEIAGKVRVFLQSHAASPNWTARFDAQVARWLEVYWVAVAAEGNYGAAYGKARKAISARKNLRHFPQMENETGRKCTLTGAMAALEIDWDRLSRRDSVQVRPNEALGAIAAIKRFAQEAKVFEKELKRFPDLDEIAGGSSSDDEPRYVAALHMDGDQMGKYLSSLTSEAAHRVFSQTLADFADKTVPKIIEKYEPGVLIYAGGDDVLALLPIQSALGCANELQTAFRQATGSLTMSAGIAIAPSNYPFDLMLDAARHAEHRRAKRRYGRDAVCVVEVHGGQVREAGMKWDDMQPVFQLQGYFYLKQVSKGIGYDLRQLAHDLGGRDVPAEARLLEARRLLKRRTGEKVDPVARTEIMNLADKLSDLAEKTDGGGERGWTAVANWAILARFLEGKGSR